MLDGTGAPAFRADVGVVGDRIAALGEIAPEQGRRVIDASGLHVAPGFIDIHTHSDPDVLAYPTADSRARQGVTTELAGNCGSSAAPLAGLGVAERVEEWKRDGIAADWTDVASYLARVEKAGLSVNHALLAGHGTLRSNAVGDVDRPLSAEESRALARALEEALDQGAFGLSTGPRVRARALHADRRDRRPGPPRGAAGRAVRLAHPQRGGPAPRGGGGGDRDRPSVRGARRDRAPQGGGRLELAQAGGGARPRRVGAHGTASPSSPTPTPTPPTRRR